MDITFCRTSPGIRLLLSCSVGFDKYSLQSTSLFSLELFCFSTKNLDVKSFTVNSEQTGLSLSMLISAFNGIDIAPFVSCDLQQSLMFSGR